VLLSTNFEKPRSVSSLTDLTTSGHQAATFAPTWRESPKLLEVSPERDRAEAGTYLTTKEDVFQDTEETEPITSQKVGDSSDETNKFNFKDSDELNLNNLSLKDCAQGVYPLHADDLTKPKDGMVNIIHHSWVPHPGQKSAVVIIIHHSLKPYLNQKSAVTKIIHHRLVHIQTKKARWRILFATVWYQIRT